MIAIVDYDAGNIRSVENALNSLGLENVVTDDAAVIRGADRVILPGKIVRIPEGGGRKIPHIGWNDLSMPKESPLFAGVPAGSYVYFVHSYYLQAGELSDVAATTEYGVTIHAAVQRGKLCASQFHPEKSGDVGMKILMNFAGMQ